MAVGGMCGWVWLVFFYLRYSTLNLYMRKIYHVCGCKATATSIILSNIYGVALTYGLYLCGPCSNARQTHKRIYATEQQSNNNHCHEMAMTEVNLWNMATKMKLNWNFVMAEQAEMGRGLSIRVRIYIVRIKTMLI